MQERPLPQWLLNLEAKKRARRAKLGRSEHRHDVKYIRNDVKDRLKAL